ncbi:MAG: PQQ-dependent sugar dehydrogenase [Acidimicrobiales bacterium]
MPSLPLRLRRLALPLVVLLAVGGLAACREAPATLTVTPVVSGLERPWDLAFTPGGGILFTERTGNIRFLPAGASSVRTLHRPTDVVVVGEGGMMGVAVDPGFVTNRRIYACFLSERSGSLDVRVARFEINQAVTALVNRVDIVTGIPAASSGRHSGCRPRFGPDGRLWIGTGDAARPTVPQDPASLGGKVLRVDSAGRGVPGNAAPPFDPRIYTYGHRNVQGIAFSPGGKAYAIEHGTYRDDEVNRLLAGANYGWDPRPLGGGSTYDESRPMTDTVRYPGARAAVWRSGSTTIAPSGGTFLSGAQWAGWDRSLAMAVLKGQQLRVLGFDNTGNAVAEEWTALTNLGRLRVAVQGPNGDLYVITDADPGRILRVRPG